MLAEQRRSKIVERVGQLGAVKTFALSQEFGVSEMTILRDLKILDEARELRMTHGGAVSIHGATPHEQSFWVKDETNHEAKSRIALFAAKHLVSRGDVIIVDPGSTGTAMVDGLREKQDLTVVSNGLLTLQRLSALLPSTTIMSTGGILRETSYSFVGPGAERFFDGFHAQTLFLSAVGYTTEFGLTDPQVVDTQVKKAMIKSAQRIVVLLDSSKFSKVSTSQVLGPWSFQVLVTDEAAPPEVLAFLRDKGVEIFQA